MNSSTEPTLDGARAKLQHSLDLLDLLEKEIEDDAKEMARKGEQWFKLAARDEVDADGVRWSVYRCVKVLRKPPERWGLLAGDAMHHARSALDHLACRLVELEGNTPTRKTAFPIWESEPANRQQVQAFTNAIEGMSKTHEEAIRSLQPYQNPQSKEAALLNYLAVLDNLTKHRALIPMIAATTSDVSVTPKSAALPANTEVRLNRDVEVKPGTWISRARPLTTLPIPSGVWVEASIGVAFGVPGVTIGILREVRAYVVGIVESFAPAFR